MDINSNDHFLVQNLSGILSPTFIDKKSDDILLIYEKENYSNINMNLSPEDLVEKISQDIDCNADGWLVFVSSEYQKKIKDLIKKEFLVAFRNDILNLTNLNRSEAILYHNVRTGIVIELVDPECFSDFFVELIEKIKAFMEDNDGTEQDFLSFDLCHMSSTISRLQEKTDGQEFLKILDENNINYYKE